MSSNPLAEALNRELSAASPMLVGNADVLRSVLAGCGDCIKILDLDGRLQFMSEGGKRVMEVDDFAPLKGCPWPEFWAGEGNVQAKAAVASAKAGNVARFQGAADTAKGTPRYWDVQVSPILGDDGAPTHLLSISRDITEERTAAEVAQKSSERQRFLTEELQHRVKNILATVLAISNQTFRGETYRQALLAFTQRLVTLGTTYDVLTEASFDTTPVARAVEAALDAHEGGAGRIRVSGPDVDLGPKQALSLALAMNSPPMR